MGNLSQNKIIQMMGNFNDNDWAHNSRFYQAVMCDGNIFNPYIHRRWLPAQFKRLVDDIRHSPVLNDPNCVITKEKALDFFSYSSEAISKLLETTLKEIELLSFLQKRDQLAFAERSLIYSFDRCQKIVLAYIKVNTELISKYDHGSYFWYYVSG